MLTVYNYTKLILYRISTVLMITTDLYRIGSYHPFTIMLQHKTYSIGIQCDLLAAAPLQKLPRESTTTVVYATDNEKVDLDTGDPDHNTMVADLDTSYLFSQQDTTPE